MLASAKAAVPTVGDAAASLSLSNAVKNLNTALAELRAAAAKVHEATSTSNDIDAALEQVRALEAELGELKRELPSGRVAPLPGETADSSASQLGSTSKTVGSSMAQLLTAAAQVRPSDFLRICAFIFIFTATHFRVMIHKGTRFSLTQAKQAGTWFTLFWSDGRLTLLWWLVRYLDSLPVCDSHPFKS